MPRVDLALESGNRGYLVGTAPPAAELKPTRQMVETTIEVPSFYKPKRGGAGQPAELDVTGLGEASGAGMVELPADAMGAQAAQVYDVYVVQKGDSLWSIAAKREIYGKATRWRELFDVNRDQLKSPNHLRPGMTLKIPRGGEGPTVTYEDEGTTFRK